MKALVISDIHGNLEALQAVLKNSADNFDQIWCLGDIVGYGPQPNECIELLKQQKNLKCIIGNHDAAAIKLLDTAFFNRDAKRSMAWTRTILTEENKQFLSSLPEQLTEQEHFTLVHGSPRAPVFEYILDTYVASLNFEILETDYCFIGHSHIPAIFTYNPEKTFTDLIIPKANDYSLKPKMIINPGSVGQPRDRNPYASYILLDTEKQILDFRRISYNIETTQSAMIEHHLPEAHIARLKLGI